MDKDYILRVLSDCSDEFFLAPHTISGKRLLRKERFDRYVYEQWAVEEILEKIEQSDYPPAMVLANLVDEIEHHQFNSEEVKNMFYILADVAAAMLDIVRAMQ